MEHVENIENKEPVRITGTWKEKLSSRKLWAAIVSAALCVAAALFGEEMSAEAADMVRCAVAAGITYIFGEGIVDAARQIAGGK